MSTSVSATLVAPDHLLRLAHPSEYEAFGNMLEDAFTSGCWITDEYKAGLHSITERAEASYVWVVEQLSTRSLVAGVLTPHTDRIRNGVSTFNILGVAAAGRGRGFGHKLVAHAIEEARFNGAETISINSSPHMTHAHQLYYNHGFVRRIERETKVVDGGQRLYSFELRLEPPTGPALSSVQRGISQESPILDQTLRRNIMAALPFAARPEGSVTQILEGDFAGSDAPLVLKLDPTAPEYLVIRILIRILGLSEDFELVAKEAASAAPVGAPAEAIIEALLTASIQEGNPNAAWLVAQTAEHEAQRLSATISEDLVEGARRAVAAESDEEREAYVRLIYARLGVLDAALADPDAYLVGTRASLVDVQLFGFLALFDLTLRTQFGWGAASIRDYPNLWRYARKLAQHDGLLAASDRPWIGLSQAPNAAGVSAAAELIEAWDIPYRIHEPIDGVLV